jgi:CHAT domain-containing protein
MAAANEVPSRPQFGGGADRTLQALPGSVLCRPADHCGALGQPLVRGQLQARHLVGHVVVAAGPGLPGAGTEAEAVAKLHAGSTTLIGTAATVQAVAASLGKARLAHLATHGKVRADNPLVSSLMLVDGPLTLYDVERLERLPRR